MYYGIYQGFVTSLKDPEKRGRIKCTCPEVLDTSESGWCEPCFLTASDSEGDFYLPPLGEGVWIMFIDGDVNRPVYLGGWWSKDKTPLESDYSSPRNTRIINYAGNTIKLTDGKIEILVGDTPIVDVEESTVTIHGDLVIEGSITHGGD